MQAGGRPAKKGRTALGARIVAAREEAGLSQVQLAERMGVSQQVVAAWERTAKALRSDTLVKLAKVLKVSADDILGTKVRAKRTGGPQGRTRKVFDEVSKLPRRKQQKIVEVVEALVNQSKDG